MEECEVNEEDLYKIPRGAFLSNSGDIYLVRCPECDRENYVLAVATGRCNWCGFDARKFNMEERKNDVTRN